MAKDQSGALQRELAEEYGINRRTVRDIVAPHGGLSRGKLTSAQIDSAVAAYLDGQSLATIAKRLGVSDHTVRSRLLERGINMRPAHGDVTVSEPTTGDCRYRRPKRKLAQEAAVARLGLRLLLVGGRLIWLPSWSTLGHLTPVGRLARSFGR